MDIMISVDNLTKSYAQHKVLKGISFQVQKGEVFALLGINGAGKTTTLECLEGLKKYEKGTVKLNGRFGIQLQSASLAENIKVGEALEFFAKWQKTSLKPVLLEKIGIIPLMKRQYASLSTGQKRRLHLALAMLGNPDIIFLDEPTAGLDVEGRANLHSLIRELKEQGKTIILASHDMGEIEALCDRIAILKEGRILYTGTVQELTRQIEEGYRLQIRFSKKPDFTKLNIPILQKTDEDDTVFETNSIEGALAQIIPLIRIQKITIQDIKVEQDSLEHRFLTMSKENS